MNKSKFIAVIFILLVSITISNVFSKAKYEGTDFISNLKIPDSFSGWHGKDVSDALGINNNSPTFAFISDAQAYQYFNEEGRSLLFIILDASNFHHPKNCFVGAGYKIRELPDSEFHLSDRSFMTHALYSTKGEASYNHFYWIVIDKTITHEWVKQKFKQLFFSLLGKQRVGLMVRIDIPVKENDIEDASKLENQFINDLSQALQPENADYILGEN